jgi:hypothetical protein
VGWEVVRKRGIFATEGKEEDGKRKKELTQSALKGAEKSAKRWAD